MAEEIVYTRFYRCPGPNAGNKGHTYESKALAAPDEIEKLRRDGGWYESLTAAEEAFDLNKSPEDSLPSTATNEERAAAADALQADAATKLNEANEALDADKAASKEAKKALDVVLQEYAEATTAKEEFDARYKDLLSRKASAEAAAAAAGKALASSTIRAQAADRALDDAATKVIAMGSLLTNQKKKALDAAVAKQKALAAAKKKEDQKANEPPAPPLVTVPGPDPTPPGPLADVPPPADPTGPGVRVKGRSL